MQGILITNGGPHGPEKWAEVTANALIQVENTSSPEKRASAYALKGAIIISLSTAYGAAQNGEVLALDADGDGVLGSPLNPGEYVDDAVAAVVNATKASPWADHFDNPVVKEALRQEVGSRIASILDIERSWHADKSGSPVAVAYKNARTKIGGTLAHRFMAPSPKSSSPATKKPKA